MNNYYDIENIYRHSIRVLETYGMPTNDAEIFVDSMLSSDMSGIFTHGIKMLPSYLEKIQKREISFNKPETTKQTSSFTVIDAKNTVGAISATYAKNIAIEQARKNGIHTVYSRNANTFGAGFYFVDKIADEGLIGFACCNSPAAMPAYNGLEVMLGTNPFAFAFPTKSYGNIVIDMASSVVAKSRFIIAKEEGKKLEPGWALDKYGNPTIEPEEAINGLVLPMAGFKGYAISMMIDILAGLLSGAAYLNKVGKFYSDNGKSMNVGHMIIAINPELIYDGNFISDADTYIEIMRTSKTIEGKEIIIPGDRRLKNIKMSKEKGLELPADVVKKLEKIFGKNLKHASDTY